jgi:hypothetical protein
MRFIGNLVPAKHFEVLQSRIRVQTIHDVRALGMPANE